MKKRKSGDIVTETADKLSLPTEAFSSPRLTWTAGRLLIEGHGGVEEYGTELITVRSKGKLIWVRGKRLDLGAMDKDELLITGRITDVEISDRGSRQ